MKKIILLLMMIPVMLLAQMGGVGYQRPIVYLHSYAVDSASAIFTYNGGADTAKLSPVAGTSNVYLYNANVALDSAGEYLVFLRIYSGGAVVDSAYSTFWNNPARLTAAEIADTVAGRGMLSSGSGANAVTIVCLSATDTTAVANVDIVIRPNGGGLPMARAYSRTNGIRVFDLDSAIYDVGYQRQGYSFTADDSIIVSGAVTETVWCTLQIPDIAPIGMTEININVLTPDYDTVYPVYCTYRIVKASDSSYYAAGTVFRVDSGVSAITISQGKTISSNTSNFQFPLYPNSAITPDSTIYKFEVKYGQDIIARTYIEVPDTTAFNPFGQ